MPGAMKGAWICLIQVQRAIYPGPHSHNSVCYVHFLDYPNDIYHRDMLKRLNFKAYHDFYNPVLGTLKLYIQVPILLCCISPMEVIQVSLDLCGSCWVFKRQQQTSLTQESKLLHLHSQNSVLSGETDYQIRAYTKTNNCSYHRGGEWHNMRLNWRAKFSLYLQCLNSHNMDLHMYYLYSHYKFPHQIIKRRRPRTGLEDHGRN